MPWIHHPATQDEPVSLWHWLKYQVGNWMWRAGSRLEDGALHPDLPF